jgi:hypothetical protein
MGVRNLEPAHVSLAYANNSVFILCVQTVRFINMTIIQNQKPYHALNEHGLSFRWLDPSGS